jgi:hypothetical protein
VGQDDGLDASCGCEKSGKKGETIFQREKERKSKGTTKKVIK